jgi:hypothetical protein
LQDDGGEDTPLSKYEGEALRKDLHLLMETKKVQKTSILLHVDNLVLEDDENSTLIRPVDRLHVENIKTLLMQKPSNFSAPFVLFVDPIDCPTVSDWDLEKATSWKYMMIGGNHGARAKSELFKTYGKSAHAEVQAWVYAGLTKAEARQLSWQHNIDQEYRKSMSNIDKVRACHNVFLEMGQIRTKEVREACCVECSLPYTPGVRDTMATHDPTFQIAFRTGEIWDLQDKIFQMWANFQVVGQVKPKSPKKAAPVKGKTKAKPRPTGSQTLNKFSGDIKLHYFRGLQGIQNKDHIQKLLRRVVSRQISLEQMFQEGEKLKKLMKVKNLFLLLSGQGTWEACRTMFPEETDVGILSTWSDKLSDQVSPSCFITYFGNYISLM